MCTYTSAYTYVYIYIYTYVYRERDIHKCIIINWFVLYNNDNNDHDNYTCMYIYIYIYTHTYTYIYIHICVYIYIYTCIKVSPLAWFDRAGDRFRRVIPTRTVSFQNFKFVFAAWTLAIWNLRQYGHISNIFAFRIWDAQFEISRFEIMKTDRTPDAEPDGDSDVLSYDKVLWCYTYIYIYIYIITSIHNYDIIICCTIIHNSTIRYYFNTRTRNPTETRMQRSRVICIAMFYVCRCFANQF